MNSSGGNIPGQMQVPMEDSPTAAASSAQLRGRRYGCNQRDDNQYYRVNLSHALDLRGVIPGGSICDENKRLVWWQSRGWYIPCYLFLAIPRA